MKQSGTVTLLITGIAKSAELLDRGRDESSEQVLRVHHKMLSEAISTCGGEELEWHGYGVAASFTSAADAVRCEIQKDPLSGHVFAFINRRKNQVKLLLWTRGGFTIVHKRLERGIFAFDFEAWQGGGAWGG